MIGEPSPTQADLRFQLFGIPVRVHPFFWAVAVLLGLRASDNEPGPLLIWVFVVFISILIHELGHALTARYFGQSPWITLYAFGGLASYNPTRHDSRSRILVCAAGPAAGFLFIALVMAAVYGSGQGITFHGSMPWMVFELFPQRNLNLLIYYLWYVNVFWGLVNLLPVYPLDGGQISREFFLQGNRADGIRYSLMLSMFCAVGMGVYGAIQLESLFIAVMFGFMAYNNYMLLQQYTGGGGYGGPRGW